MKKVIALILALAIALSLVACGDKTDNKTRLEKDNTSNSEDTNNEDSKLIDGDNINSNSDEEESKPNQDNESFNPADINWDGSYYMGADGMLYISGDSMTMNTDEASRHISFDLSNIQTSSEIGEEIIANCIYVSSYNYAEEEKFIVCFKNKETIRVYKYDETAQAYDTENFYEFN